MNSKERKVRPSLEDPENIIDAEDFEHLCDCLIEAWRAARSTELSFEQIWAEPSPVDIVLHEVCQGKNTFHSSAGHSVTWKKKHNFKKTHFIECKFYRKNLSLDVIAKSLLVAIRYSPASFTIASNTRLEPQAEEYLNYVINETPQAPESITVWYPLWKELRGKKPQLTKYEPRGIFGESYSIDSIRLQIKDHLRSAAVPTNQGGIFRLHDKSQIDFRCRLLLPLPPVRSRTIEQIILTLGGNDEHQLDIPVLRQRISARCRDPIELEGSILATDLKPGYIYTDWKLVLVGKGKYLHRYPLSGLPYLARSISGPMLPELRKEETETLYAGWMNSDRPILLVSGLGGIGKTHFCESIICQSVAQGFRAAEVSLASEYDPSFIIDFAWCAFGSRLRHLLEGQTDIASTFIKTQLAGSEQNFSQPELEVLVKAVTSGTLEYAQTEILLGNLARLIVLKNKPIVFYIRDLHKATDTVRNSLRHIIKGFESAGWGQVRIILEQRTVQTDNSQKLEQNKLGTEPDLWTWLKHFFRNRTYSYEEMALVPLKTISGSLQSVFYSDGAKKAVDLLAKKSQGNLQELSFMLQRLHDDGTIVAEPFFEADQEHIQYIVPSLSKFRRRLAAISTDESSSTLLRINEMHEKLLEAGKAHGCLWLGLLSILDMEVDAKLFTSLLHLDETVEVEPLLDFFVCAGFLVRQGKGLSFAHENISNATKKWFTGLPLHALWLRENAVAKVLPTRFEDGFARGRIWTYLREPQSAFRAFDAALGYSAEDFSRQFRCHKEIHQLLIQLNENDYYERFFANFSRLSSCGQYVLSSEDQIELQKEALTYLDSMEAEHSLDSQYGSLRCSLHHALSCQYLSRMSISKYFEHARKALFAAGSLHDIAKMLNRLLMACTRSGDANTGLEVGASALALATLIPPEQDPDLLSVNYGEFSFAVASSYPNLALWLAEVACANRFASRRQQSHDLYVLACALAQNGKIQDSYKALESSWQIASPSNMHSLLLSLKNCRGVLNGSEGHWGEAKRLFEQSLEEAAWLGCLPEALKAKQNLMISLAMIGCFSEAAPLYVDLLRECKEDSFTFHPKEGMQLLVDMRNRADEMLRRRRLDKNNDLKLEGLETQVRARLQKFYTKKAKNTYNITRNIILINALTLFKLNQDIFPDPQEFAFLKSDLANAMRNIPSNAIQCAKNNLQLHIIC